MTAQDVLAFWLPAPPDDPRAIDAANARWFGHDPALDADIRRRFGPLIDAARNGELEDWANAPRSWLACLILLDQFPRNVYRGSPLAFAGDLAAQSLARHGIAAGYDAQLAPIERLFAYLPFEHAESLAAQDESLRLFGALAQSVPAALGSTFDNYLNYARRHRDVIVQFGRFPHRNAVLGRANTPEESAWLAAGNGF